MARIEAKRKTYIIPDNFISESRIFQGRFRIRYLIEGVILAVLVMLPFFFSNMNYRPKIFCMIVFGMPLLIVGIIGINGDPISVAIKTYISWKRQYHVMIFDPNPRVLTQKPIAAFEEETGITDKLSDYITERQKKREEKLTNYDLQEGVNMEFAADSGLDWLIQEEEEEASEDTESEANEVEEDNKHKKGRVKRRRKARKAKGDTADAEDENAPDGPQNAEEEPLEINIDINTDHSDAELEEVDLY